MKTMKRTMVGLAVAAALTPVLVYRTLRPLWIPSAVRR